MTKLPICSRCQAGGVIWRRLIPVAVLVLAICLGYRASWRWLVLLAAGIVGGVGSLVLLEQPGIGLFLIVPAALIGHLEISTGTAVVVNPVTLFVPALTALWVLDMARRRDLYFVPSRTNGPLFLFVLGGLFSLLVGSALWDPAVPRSGSFVLVQLAQWAIFAFSALAYWLMGNVVRDEISLRRLTLSYLVVAGCLAVLYVIPRVGFYVHQMTSGALYRAPFWLLLLAVAGGQLLFNQELSSAWRIFLGVVAAATQVFALYWNRETASTWVSLFAVAGVLAWLRWSRLRWPVVLLLVVFVVTGMFTSTIYEFAGGDDEWEESGGSRLTLIGRVLEVTMHNPITGLGPAAYRAYAQTKPLLYGKALWLEPQINSHNNYVDLFSHGGLLGLGLFGWFAIELTFLGLRLRTRFPTGFAAGYVNALLAAWAGALVLMLFADWILPFVYNIGFPGFQASVLVWFFLGGLVALEQMSRSQSQDSKSTNQQMSGSAK
ncbi:MAG: O-antigen ligase family protein [Anaerolineae bacterium]|nr:O-antigen ligase family protein [Anaerolineae bacterium]